jgi:predicted nucleic acid-binding protein
MYLLDSNILLELLLDQEKADDVQRLLLSVTPRNLYLTEFSLYSIGIILIRQKKHAVFVSIVQVLIENATINLLRLLPDDMRQLADHAERFNLDFDAYQYTAAEKYGLTIVSFDSDFDRTTIGRREPAEIAS